jgi:hypothetical protein
MLTTFTAIESSDWTALLSVVTRFPCRSPGLIALARISNSRHPADNSSNDHSGFQIAGACGSTRRELRPSFRLAQPCSPGCGFQSCDRRVKNQPCDVRFPAGQSSTRICQQFDGILERFEVVHLFPLLRGWTYAKNVHQVSMVTAAEGPTASLLVSRPAADSAGDLRGAIRDVLVVENEPHEGAAQSRLL